MQTKEDENALELVVKTYERYANLRKSNVYGNFSSRDIGTGNIYKSIEDKWLDNFMIIRQILNKSERLFDGRPKVTIPKGYQIVNLIYPRIEQSVFSSREYFSVSGFEPSDHEKADKIKQLLYWNHEKINARQKFVKAIHDFVDYGTCIVKVFWNYGTEDDISRKKISELKNGDERDRKLYQEAMTMKEIDDNGNEIPKYNEESLVTIEQDKIKDDNFDFEVLDPGLFYMNPVVDDIDKASTVEKKYVSYEDLMRINYYDKEKIKKCKDSGISSDTYDYYIQEKQRMMGLNVGNGNEILTGTTGDIEGKTHQLLIYWGRYAIDPNDKDSDGNVKMPLCEIVVLDKQEVICMRKSPYYYKKKPYVVCRYDRFQNEAYGGSALDQVIRLLKMINTASSQIQENMNLVLSAPMLKRVSIKMPPISRLLSGQTIDVPEGYDPTRDFVRLNIPDVSMSGWNNVDKCSNIVEEATSAVRILAGLDYSQNTAAGTNVALKEANMRFKSGIYNFQGLIADVTKWCYKMNQQFMTIEKQIRIINPGTEQQYSSIWVSPEDMQIEADIIPNNATTELDKMIKLKALTDFFNVANHYMNDNGMFNPVIKDAVRMLFEMTDNGEREWKVIEKTMFPPPPPPEPTAQIIDIQRKANKDQQEFIIDQERIKTDRVRILADFVSKLPKDLDPEKADIYKKSFLNLGFSDDEWDQAELLLYGGKAINLDKTGDYKSDYE